MLLLGLTACSRREFLVPTSSMVPTIHPNERVLADMAAYSKVAPARWEVVVARMPADPNAVTVRRVIGLPGETVDFQNGRFLINGKALVPPAPLQHLAYTNQVESPENVVVTLPYVVPANSFYLLGDNSSRARDSRFHGAVPGQWLVGRVEQRVTTNGTHHPVR
jgi:signal peptidase I